MGWGRAGQGEVEEDDTEGEALTGQMQQSKHWNLCSPPTMPLTGTAATRALEGRTSHLGPRVCHSPRQQHRDVQGCVVTHATNLDTPWAGHSEVCGAGQNPYSVAGQLE